MLTYSPIVIFQILAILEFSPSPILHVDDTLDF